MERPEAVTLLKELIEAKEAEHKIEAALLKNHFRQTFESLRPLNVIKDTFKEVISSPDIRKTVVTSAIGFVTSFITKKLLSGSISGPLPKVLKTIVEKVAAR